MRAVRESDVAALAMGINVKRISGIAWALAAVFETPLGSLDETGIAGHYRRAITERHQGVDPEVEAMVAK